MTKFARLSTVFGCIVCLTIPSYAALVTTRILDFNDNKLPAGWTLDGNIEIANQRLQGGANALGLLLTAIDSGSADKITISYDASLSLHNTSGFTVVQTRGAVAAAQSVEYIIGRDVRSLGLTSLNSLIHAAHHFIYDKNFTDLTLVPDFHVNYHVSTTLLNGFISQTLTNLSTSQTFASGLIKAPGYRVSNVNELSLLLQTSGSRDSAWIDNIQVTTTRSTERPPQAFGLFLGEQDSLGSKIAYRGDVTANSLAKIWRAKGLRAEVITRNIDAKESLSLSEIRAKLISLISTILPGDTIFIYAAGHGASVVSGASSSNAKGDGYEYLDYRGNRDEAFSDLNLTALLKDVDPYGLYTKKVFIDSCHSGGFWGSGDPNENGSANLESVPNTMLYASASEAKVAYFNPRNGESFFGSALEDALSTGAYWDDSPTDLQRYIKQRAIYHATNDGSSQDDPEPVAFFAEQQFGDLIAADPSLVETYFSTNVTLPEPSPLLLVALAGAMMGIAYRKTHLI